MSTIKTATVERIDGDDYGTGEGGLGSSQTSNLEDIFETSPIYTDDMTDSTVTQQMKDFLCEDVISEASSYWGLTYEDSDGATANGFDLNYLASPDLTSDHQSIQDPDSDGDGTQDAYTIANNFMPNPASPGESSSGVNFNYKDIPDPGNAYAAGGSTGNQATAIAGSALSTEWGSGHSSVRESTASPSYTSNKISGQQDTHSLGGLFGRSYDGSDGSS